MSGPDGTPAAGRSRRGFIRAAGLAVTGGAALGMSGRAHAEVQAVAGSASALSTLRRQTYGALVEAVASVRDTGRAPAADIGAALGGFAVRYAAVDPPERARIDGTLDAVERVFAPGGLAAYPVQHRLQLLAEQLRGPHEGELTAAIGLAVAGLDGTQPSPARAQAAGRLYAWMIRTLPDQREERRARPVRNAGHIGAACTPSAT